MGKIVMEDQMNKVSKAFALGVLSIASFGATVAADAQGLDLYIGNGDRGRYYDDGDNGRYYPQRRYRGTCDPNDAIDTAMSYGMRRVRIVGETRRALTLAGIGKRGERTSIVLSNDPSCRRLGWR